MARAPRSDSPGSVGARLRLIRLAYGNLQSKPNITQAEFAALCDNINRQAWNNAETGDSRLGLDNAMKVCRRTGVSLDYIYFGETAGLPLAMAMEIERIEKAGAAKKA